MVGHHSGAAVVHHGCEAYISKQNLVKDLVKIRLIPMSKKGKTKISKEKVPNYQDANFIRLRSILNDAD